MTLHHLHLNPTCQPLQAAGAQHPGMFLAFSTKFKSSYSVWATDQQPPCPSPGSSLEMQHCRPHPGPSESASSSSSSPGGPVGLSLWRCLCACHQLLISYHILFCFLSSKILDNISYQLSTFVLLKFYLVDSV